MDYEKLYKEALEKAQKELQCCGTLDCDAARQIFRLFPELCESKDEKIRRELLEYLDERLLLEKLTDTPVKKEWISWLEKQGENVYNEELSKLLHEVICSFINNPNIKYSKREEVSKKIIPYVEKIEKQGSQNLANSAKTCKVEPKFKVGDWVVNKYGHLKYITKIENDCYYAEGEYDEWHGTFEYGNTHFRLWTIQNAKDGDVLYCKNNGIEYIVMNKGINEIGNIDSYFRYNSLDGFGIDIPSVLSVKYDNITPATKEQRDLLFQKMSEAGYTWDSKTKQLIKKQS